MTEKEAYGHAIAFLLGAWSMALAASLVGGARLWAAVLIIPIMMVLLCWRWRVRGHEFVRDD